LPYHGGEYQGRAFSNRESLGKISPSLRNILKEIEDDIYDGFNINQNPDLLRLEEQGVFLINKVLTVRKKSPNSHKGIGWEEFISKVISTLSDTQNNLVFMLWGNNAKAIKPAIDEKKHLILESGHPSPMSANMGYWFGNKHFSKANEYLELNKKDKIIW
jgi:uracil-DNA glycosylase